MAQLKFYKNSIQPATATQGSVWFNTIDKTIEVYNGSTWEKFAGKLMDAQWNTESQKLTISKADGSSITLDFSNIASLSGVQAALAALKSELTPLITAAQNAADAAQTHSDGVAGDLATEVTNRTNADNDLGVRIDGVVTDLQSEVARATGVEAGFETRIAANETAISNLASATHFLGVKNRTEVKDPVAGDIVVEISGDQSKEYIYDSVKGWVELGDTTAEMQKITANEGAISALQGEVANLKAKDAELVAKDAELVAKDAAQDEVIATLETKAKVEEIRADLQGQISSNDSDIQTLTTNLAGTEAKAEKNKGDIATINETLETLATAENLQALETRVTNVETKNGTQDTAIQKNADDLAAYKTEVGNTYATKTSLAETEAKAEKNKDDIADHETRITELETESGDFETRVSALETFKNTTVPGTYVTKSAYDTKMSALDAKDSAHDDAIAALQSKDAELVAEDQRLAGLIGDAGSGLTKALADEVARAKAAEKVNSDAIATEVTRADTAEKALDTKFTGEVSRLDTKIENSIAAALAWEEFE